jgi:hypothetical protein
LHYNKDGGDYFEREKSWLLSGGAAIPTSGRSPFVAALIAGPAPVAGMREGEFIAVVREVCRPESNWAVVAALPNPGQW